MSGYRQHGFDPGAFEQPGAPLRPYNWVQWTGIALGSVGMALTLLHFAGRADWIPQLVEGRPPFLLLIVGVVLINSRRAPSTVTTPEQQARNKRTLVITVAICAIIFGIAAAIEFSGA